MEPCRCGIRKRNRRVLWHLAPRLSASSGAVSASQRRCRASDDGKAPILEPQGPRNRHADASGIGKLKRYLAAATRYASLPTRAPPPPMLLAVTRGP